MNLRSMRRRHHARHRLHPVGSTVHLLDTSGWHFWTSACPTPALWPFETREQLAKQFNAAADHLRAEFRRQMAGEQRNL